MALCRVILVGIFVGMLTIVGAAAPASATSASAAATPTDVTGEPWSSPAHPVTCNVSAAQVSCVPDNASEIKPQKCYLGVLMAGERVAICTTYEGHASAIQAAGGKEVMVGYGCSLGDVVCVTFENAGRGMALATMAMMFSVAENMKFDTSTLLWDAATGEWSFWAWAVLIVLLVAMMWSVTAAAISGERRELVGALLRSFLAFPASVLSLWATGHVLNAIDDLTWYILSRDGAWGLFRTLQQVMWAGGEANYFFGFLIHALLMIGLLLLMLVFTFRNIALAALIMIGPLAWMIYPVRGIGPQWVVRYFSALIVLLLTAPLTIAFVTLIVNGLSAMDSIWNPQAWPLLVGLVMVSFAPFAVFGLFSFVGAVAADSLGSNLGSRAAGAARTAGRTVTSIPTRLGGSPAGISSGGPSTSTSSTAGSRSRIGGSVMSPSRSGRTAGAARPASAATPGGRASARPTPSPSPQTSVPPRKEGSVS